MEAMTTEESITRQWDLSYVGLRKGKGNVERTGGGAFVVYSRISDEDLLCEIQRSNSSITNLSQMKTIFLMGPTPKFYGEARASTSWRREFLSYADTVTTLNEDWLIVLPEPYDCNWASVDYDSLEEGEEQIFAQIHWEDYFIERSIQRGIAVFHSHFRWKGNAGPTARFEGGRLLASLDKMDRLVFNLSPDSQNVPYLEAHLARTYKLHESGSFKLTRCSPFPNQESQTKEEESPGQLNEFFQAIISLVSREKK